jgi:hypothetical protein
MASYSSFTKTRSPVLGICILTLTTLYRQSFSLNALAVYTTLVSEVSLGRGTPSLVSSAAPVGVVNERRFGHDWIVNAVAARQALLTSDAEAVAR